MIQRIIRDEGIAGISFTETSNCDKIQIGSILTEIPQQLDSIGTEMDVIENKEGLPRNYIPSEKRREETDYLCDLGLIAEDVLQDRLLKKTEADIVSVFMFSELLCNISFSYHRSALEKEGFVSSFTLPFKQVLINFSFHKAKFVDSAIYTFLDKIQRILHFLRCLFL